MNNKGVLLVNLGSPDSTDTKDVRKYLKQFLSDPRVLDSPDWVRALVLNLTILPFRPKKTAEAYKRIWKEEGSPLILTSKELQDLVAKNVPYPVELAMTYGKPSIPESIRRLHKQGITEIFLIPLYPHYAMSSYETAVVAVNEAIQGIAPDMKVVTMLPYYKDEGYIHALVESAKPYLEDGFDKLLFSFHGIPERHLRKSDPSRAHCTIIKDCCATPSACHATCYKHQCFETVKAFVNKAGLSKDQYQVSFQSRLGRDPWLTPYTDKTLEELPSQGVKKLLVICPAFVSDCLETLEEIQMEGKESFLEAGGEAFHQIPCLNTHPEWVKYLKERITLWT